MADRDRGGCRGRAGDRAAGVRRRTKATTVNVTAGKPSELKFTSVEEAVAKGIVTFKVTNKGALAHDFKIGGKVTGC